MLRSGRRPGLRSRLGPWLLATALLTTALLVTGCLPGPRPEPIAPLDGAVSPADAQSLLPDLASCHLLRVAQNLDVAVTDAVVLEAAGRFDVAMEQVVERANALIAADAAQGSALLEQGAAACARLAALTGETAALVRFEPDGRIATTWLRIEGAEITEGFAARVIADLQRSKAVGLLINSPGGSVYEARTLGRYLRANGLRTAVDHFCGSACVDVLAGGVERYVTPDAKLGIHQSRVPSRYSSHEGGQRYVADSFRYLREMGVQAEVAIAAAAVPHDQILLIPLADALATGLVTGVVAGFE